jgi:uncharacterized protein (DUF433 family)
MNWKGCAAVESRNDQLSGAVVFAGTRIPVATLFENLKAGATVDEFLEWFPEFIRAMLGAPKTTWSRTAHVDDFFSERDLLEPVHGCHEAAPSGLMRAA